MNDLEHVAGIECRMNSLIALIVGKRMQVHLVKHSAVFTVKNLTKEEEFSLLTVREFTQTAQELMIKAVCNVKTQTVNIEEIDPVVNLIEDVIYDSGITKIKLYEVVVTFPAFIPEAVVIVGVAVERQMEPILIG